MGHYGVDVSSNNTHPVNWAAVHAYLTQLGGDEPFLIVKLTEATNYVNPDDATDVAAARAAGFKAVAGYLFDHGNTDPAAEVNYAKAHSLGLPIFDDIEDPAGLTAAQYAAHARALVALTPAALEYLNQSEVAEGFPADRLWLAQYNGQPGVTRYRCLIHQYTSTGTIPACTGTFDLNLWRGTEAQFASTFRLTVVPAPAGSVCTAPVTDPEVDNMQKHLINLPLGPDGVGWTPTPLPYPFPTVIGEPAINCGNRANGQAPTPGTAKAAAWNGGTYVEIEGGTPHATYGVWITVTGAG